MKLSDSAGELSVKAKMEASIFQMKRQDCLCTAVLAERPAIQQLSNALKHQKNNMIDADWVWLGIQTLALGAKPHLDFSVLQRGASMTIGLRAILITVVRFLSIP